MPCGSSPLTRGKPRLAGRAKRPKRLIPAHAGKTWPCASSVERKPAHPRSRGENADRSSPTSGGTGSSPLTRGKRPRAPHLRAAHRLIPAHAGKTLAAPRGRRGSSAHPRSRGENVGSSSRATSCRGSSPLTRGKLRFGTLGVLVGGLIPAHAGKTRLGRRCVSASEAHPRSRGENAGMHAELWGASGSSPLTRGKPRSHAHHSFRQRLIPAHAGKTRS